jgi:tRNA nucleotidyltransferase/poly(A) polymerase
MNTAATTTTQFDFFEVGGAVRDALLNLDNKDVDFAVVASDTTLDATDAFDALVAHLEAEGFRVFETKPEFLTVRAKCPVGHPLAARTDVADFVLARVDGPSSDGRRPDFVQPGTLLDDLARRDFTVNAMALAADGTLVDPFDGQSDLATMSLRFVGDAKQRVAEDGLRVLRAFRFMVTKGFTPTDDTFAVLTSDFAASMLGSVSKERKRDELDKMFQFDTLGTLALLGTLPQPTLDAMFPDGLRLMPTMKK